MFRGDWLSDNLQMQVGGPKLFTASDLERAFRGKIRPVRVPLVYRAGLLGVALGLVLLQIIYVGMVGLSAWLTYLYLLLIP